MAGAHVIDIDQLVASATTSGINSESGEHEIGKSSIYRISQHSRNKYKDAYEPFMLSIGPYNHMIPATHAMQITKYEFLDYILKLNHGKSLSEFLEAMKELEKQVRSCYAYEIDMDKTEFLKMLLLDGCFMLVNLCRIEESMFELQESNELKREIDIRTNKDCSKTEDVTKLHNISSSVTHEDLQEDSYPIDQLLGDGLWHDLLLLENQIPLLVIVKIHELVGGNNPNSKPVEKIIELVETALCSYPIAIRESNRPKDFHHLLHLCHMYFIPHLAKVESCESEVKTSMFHSFLHLGSNLFRRYATRPFYHGLHDSLQWNQWRRATEYHQAGIDFRKRKYCSENPHSLLDVAFCNGTIEIPCLIIETNTKTLFCNLIAFEQTCPRIGSYVTAYIKFLSQLIHKPDDVSLLTQRGIIVHQLNSDVEVCDLFLMIGDCVACDADTGYLKPLCYRIEAYYASRKPMLRELSGSVARWVHHWAQERDSLGLPTTTTTHGASRSIA